MDDLELDIPALLTAALKREYHLDDVVYYEGYEDLEVHRVMLEDKPRVLAYKKAILENKEFFKDKVVMDVGCGTGILSIFCAQAGAKKVYAVEASGVAKLAKETILINKLHEVIEVIESKVEDVVLPDDIKVDAIVSEWMGFFLLHEGMLDSVFAARDKFLKPDGKMFPESAVLYVAPCGIPKYNNYWTDYEGINMRAFGFHLREEKRYKPEIMVLEEKDLLGAEEALCWINLTEDKVTDLDSYSLQHVLGSKKAGRFEGICMWFECIFPNGIVLDTSPRSEATHWKQTVIVLPQGRCVDVASPIAYKLDMNRDPENARRYNITAEILDYEMVDHPIPCTCYMTKCILIKTLMTSHERHAKEAQLEQQQELEKKRMSVGTEDETGAVE